MLFTSPVFLFIFLPVALGFYLISPNKFRNIWLILVSLFFYTWGEGKYIGILMLMIVVNYFLGLIIERSKHRLIWTIATIIFDLGYIFYFKYLIFLVSILSGLLTRSGREGLTIPEIVMPLGISFVTFHLISYIFDVYRREIKAEKNFLDWALYILMFPHLIAGPIVRYKDIGTQIKNRQISSDLFAEGVRRFIGGFGKKMLIANVMALVADRIFSTFPQYLSGQLVWLALLSYSIQIYFDFSGYSDMAIGLAKMFGFTFKENFNFPYIATSIQDFWRRWHISLSSWFRDYVYIPLGGNRKGNIRTIINIAVVFALTGLWHGANWHYIFWGVYYGFFLILERLFLGKLLEKIGAIGQHLYTLFVVIMGWIFFRVESLSYAGYLLKVMFGINPYQSKVYNLGTFVNWEYTSIFLIALIIATPLGGQIYGKIVKRIPAMEIVFLGIVLGLSIMQVASNTYNPFIYFRF